MPRVIKRPRDFNQAAKLVVDIASGQIQEQPTRDAASPQSLGGKARATALKSKQRTEIAKSAAAARWKRRQEKSDA
jgi:hypothetical protein